MSEALRPDAPTPLWVFAYGSLLWNPEFPVQEKSVADLKGWRRAFCMRSIHHRGTIEAPGLVLALDLAPESVCTGMALRVADGAEQATLEALRERELISSAYLERWLGLDLRDGRQLTALAYVVDQTHNQYCGDLALEDQAQIISNAVGGRGPNCDYLLRTSEHLSAVGLADSDLDWLSMRVRRLTGKDAS